MTLVDGVSLAAGFVGLLTGSAALARLLVTHGGDRQRLNDLEGDRSNFATSASVSAMEGRVGKLEEDVKEARAALATIPVMDERQKGFEKLMTSQMDEVRHGVRGVRQALETMSADRVRRSRSTTD